VEQKITASTNKTAKNNRKLSVESASKKIGKISTGTVIDKETNKINDLKRKRNLEKIPVQDAFSEDRISCSGGNSSSKQFETIQKASNSLSEICATPGDDCDQTKMLVLNEVVKILYSIREMNTQAQNIHADRVIGSVYGFKLDIDANKWNED